jgi:hypothetical protein
MNNPMTIALGVSVVLFVVMLLRSVQLKSRLKKREAEFAAARAEIERKREEQEAELTKLRNQAESAANSQKLVHQQITELKAESERIRQHYEAEMLKAKEVAQALLCKTLQEVETLKKYETIPNAEAEIQRLLSEAITEAAELRSQAYALVEQARAVS